MNKKIIKIGDCYEIPLSDGQKTYGQYVFWDERYGPLVQIFDKTTGNPILVEQITGPKRLFPPVFIGLEPPIRAGRWKVFGWSAVKEFSFPKFRLTTGTTPGVYHNWQIYDGKNLTFVGDLDPRFRELEFLCGWSASAIETRIRTGQNQFEQLL